jgi:hypothetical protein
MNPFKPDRRQLFAGLLPACALTCLGGNALAEEKHKFDKAMDHPMSYATYVQIQYMAFLSLAKALEKEWGKDKLLAFLKKAKRPEMLSYGKRQAKQMRTDSFKAYVGQFKGPHYEQSLTMDIVEDTDTAFEIKVTECLWAKTFLDMKAGDIGHAFVCFGDYAWAEGFNPKIKLVRDKTLMQGHGYCNHRYILQE